MEKCKGTTDKGDRCPQEVFKKEDFCIKHRLRQGHVSCAFPDCKNGANVNSNSGFCWMHRGQVDARDKITDMDTGNTRPLHGQAENRNRKSPIDGNQNHDQNQNQNQNHEDLSEDSHIIENAVDDVVMKDDDDDHDDDDDDDDDDASTSKAKKIVKNLANQGPKVKRQPRKLLGAKSPRERTKSPREISLKFALEQTENELERYKEKDCKTQKEASDKEINSQQMEVSRRQLTDESEKLTDELNELHEKLEMTENFTSNLGVHFRLISDKEYAGRQKGKEQAAIIQRLEMQSCILQEKLVKLEQAANSLKSTAKRLSQTEAIDLYNRYDRLYDDMIMKNDDQTYVDHVSADLGPLWDRFKI